MWEIFAKKFVDEKEVRTSCINPDVERAAMMLADLLRDPKITDIASKIKFDLMHNTFEVIVSLDNLAKYCVIVSDDIFHKNYLGNHNIIINDLEWDYSCVELDEIKDYINEEFNDVEIVIMKLCFISRLDENNNPVISIKIDALYKDRFKRNTVNVPVLSDKTAIALKAKKENLIIRLFKKFKR